MNIAGAPISWGVCEVPGWGYQMTAHRVLTEMVQVGLAATEFGPAGFLPEAPAERAEVLERHGLAAAGGFIPLVLHRGPVGDAIDAELAAFVAASAATLVIAAVSGTDGYDAGVALSQDEWRCLARNLDDLSARAADRGITATLHPHIGTVIERPDDVDRVLGSSGIDLCLDTGHYLIGGGDPAALAGQAAGRIAHVHLKDVDAATAARVGTGELGYTAAVGSGLYRPLGAGDVDLPGVVGSLSAAGYDGWWVMEQDAILTEEPAADAGPQIDVHAGVDYLRTLADA
ncbi:MAG: TIM barrel protein [Mycobacteriales bacterium]